MPTSAWASLARRFTPSNAIPIRSFSTTPPRLRKTFIAHQIPSRIVPPYPYGYRQVYKQSNKGLYGSARIRFGNTVSEKWNRKSRRSWSPNVIVKIFKSPSLKARFRARLTIPTLKTIYHEGGIENYLLKSKAARIKDLGPAGWRLRWLLMQTKAVQHRFNEQRKAMGLEEKPIVDNDHVINYALDCACQGRLSLHNRAIHAQRPNMDTIFLGGDEPLSNAQNAEELSAEKKTNLLKQVESKSKKPIKVKSLLATKFKSPRRAKLSRKDKSLMGRKSKRDKAAAAKKKVPKKVATPWNQAA